MAVMLFKLRGVEDEEAFEIRDLLAAQNIDFYETNNGRWGLGYAAMWLHSDADLSKGKQLIQAYQQQRQQRARAAYAQQCEAGEQTTMWQVLKQRPFQVILVVLGVLFMASLTLLPFVYL